MSVSASDVKITRTLADDASVIERVKWWVKKLLQDEPVVTPEEVDALMLAEGFIPARAASMIAGVPVDVLCTAKGVTKGWPPGFPESLKSVYVWIRKADAERIRDARSASYIPYTVKSEGPTAQVVEEATCGPMSLSRPSRDDIWEGGNPAPPTQVEEHVLTVDSRWVPGRVPTRAKPKGSDKVAGHA